MKYSAALAALAMASAASAAPTVRASDLDIRTGDGGGGGGGGNGDVCTNNQKQVCCNGLLACAVQILGAGCNGGTYCCNTNAPIGSLINISLLNCLSIL